MNALLLCGALFAASLGADELPAFPAQAEAIGQSATTLKHSLHRLCSPPLSDTTFVLSDVSFDYQRRFTQYSGDVSGRMLGALTTADAVLNDSNKMTELLRDQLPQYQQPDGHFGVPQNLEESITQERDMPILWGNGRLLRALAEVIQHNPDSKLRESAIALGDYICSTRKYYGKRENFEQIGGTFASGFTTCYPSLIDGLVQLGIATQEERFLDEAAFIADLSLLDSAFEKRHSHGRLTAYRGMLELDAYRGSKTYVDAVQKGVREISEKWLMPTGGIPEIFDIEYQRDEGCSEADWAWVNLHLWRLTGDTSYLDAADLVINTHMAATQFDNGGFGHGVFVPAFEDGESWRWGRIGNYASDSYWCCSMHGTQLLGDLAYWAVLTRDDDVLITWLGEVDAALGDSDGRVRVTKTAPDAWRVESFGVPTGKTLRMRLPGWSEGLMVDGTLLEGRGWIDLPLPEGDSAISVQQPPRIRIAAPYAYKAPTGPGLARLFNGGALLCLPDAVLPVAAQNSGEAPTVYLHASTSGDTLPAFVKCHGIVVNADLVPVTKRPKGPAWLLFNAEYAREDTLEQLRKDAQPAREPGQFITFAFASDTPYDVYLNGDAIFHHAGWEESPYVDVEVRPGHNTLAVKTPAKSDKPGVIGFIRGAAVAVTTPDWQAFPTGDIPTPELLTGESPAGAVPLGDRGGFGAAPWNYTPAHFAGTDARWIWPDVETDQPAWLFRYSWEE